MKHARLLPLAIGLFVPFHALAAWPTDDAWLPFQKGGVDLYDVPLDHVHLDGADGSVDLVGDATLLAPVAYWYADDLALYLRMRVNEDPRLTPASSTLRSSGWAFLLDTDTEPTTFEYMLGLTGPGTLWLGENNPYEGDGPYDTVETFPETWLDPVGDDLVRVLDAGTTISSAADFFIDMQFDRATLDLVTGNALDGTFGVVIITEHLPLVVSLDNDIAGNDDSAGPGSMPDHTTDAIGIDQDGDGLTDPEEAAHGTDPTDGDSDDDGLGDGTEVDLTTDPLACDSDGDGLSDGLESGVTEEDLLDSPDTDTTAGCFTPDSDPTTTTNPNSGDTDGGTLWDGLEDVDGDGFIDPWETDPNDPSDDVDLDGDSIPDGTELECPLDGTADDQDGDGIPDVVEGLGDTDGDGFPDFCDVDDDDDGIPTDVEGGDDTDGDGVPDNEDPDADGDGIPDIDEGTADDDCDGIPNYQDADPTDGPCADTDGDGLDNQAEDECASDSNNQDTDGDGIPDGEESCDEDADCDDLPDILDGDHDPDGCDSAAGDDTGGPACNSKDPFLDCGHYTGGACSVVDPRTALLPALLALAGVMRRRRRTAVAAVAIGGTALGGVGTAFAQDEFNAQRFRPVPDGRSLLTVEDASVPGPGLGGGFWFNYAADPLVYRYDDDQDDTRLTGDVATANLAAFFTLSRFRLAVDMPLHLAAGSDVGAGGFSPGDLRFDLKATLVDRAKTGFGIGAAIDLGLPTGDEAAWLGDPGVTFGGRIIATAGRKRGILSANLGVRGGPPADLLPDLTWGTRLFWGVGGGVPVVEELDAFAEIDGEVSFTDLDALGAAPMEWRAGVKYYPRPEIVVTGAFGTGITTGVGAPDFRVVAGLSWVPVIKREADVVTTAKGPDRDGDGIEDTKDLCPGQPEDRNGRNDDDGCPDAGLTPTRIQVIDPRGQRVANASVELVSGPESGRYVLGSGEMTRSLPPGKYKVLALADNFEDEAAVMEVPDNDRFEYTFTLEPVIAGGRLIVIAENEQGMPVSALVTVLGGGKKFTTGPDGVGEERLPPGAVEVSVWAEGYQAERVKANILKEEPAKVTVVLKKARAIVKDDRVEILDKVFFEFDSATIKAESFRILDEVTAILMNHPEITLVEVQGHTDDQGTDTYNLGLSDRRAAAVRDYLVTAGVEAARLQAKGYGESDPLQPGVSEEAREANRRVVFQIRKGGSGAAVRPSDTTGPSDRPRGQGAGKPPRPEDRPKPR
ncbi:MAG: OmpA family protein [Myxococcota bacterium]